MKRVFASLLIVITFVLLLFPSYAQRRRRSHARETEVDANTENCPTTIEGCPPEGCGPDADFELNKVKNRIDEPSATDVKSITLNKIRSFKQPPNWPLNKDRASLQTPGREGSPVVVKGFLLKAKKESGESCNCGIVGIKNTDIHLVIVDDPNDIEATSVTMEMTPRVRRNGHSNWTQPKVKDFEGEFVRITGYLMLDTKHIGNPLVRSTNWEVHPILKFEHCTKSISACKAGNGWEEFN